MPPLTPDTYRLTPTQRDQILAILSWVADETHDSPYPDFLETHTGEDISEEDIDAIMQALR